MSREIKFNAWNKERETMHLDILSPDNWSFSFLNRDIFEWVQFTGLIDKHGNEIYEGDILKRHGYTWGMLNKENGEMIRNVISSENILLTDEKIIVAKFEITPTGICFLLPKDRNYAERTHPATYEIIGNIYSNPELIEKK